MPETNQPLWPSLLPPRHSRPSPAACRGSRRHRAAAATAACRPPTATVRAGWSLGSKNQRRWTSVRKVSLEWDDEWDFRKEWIKSTLFSELARCQSNLTELSRLLQSLEILQRTQSAPNFTDMQVKHTPECKHSNTLREVKDKNVVHTSLICYFLTERYAASEKFLFILIWDKDITFGFSKDVFSLFICRGWVMQQTHLSFAKPELGAHVWI